MYGAILGDMWLPLFFSLEALHKGETANIVMPVALGDVLKIGLEREDLSGVVIDPFDKPFTLNKKQLKEFLSVYEDWRSKINEDCNR